MRVSIVEKRKTMLSGDKEIGGFKVDFLTLATGPTQIEEEREVLHYF